jgi:hypothetical protein
MKMVPTGSSSLSLASCEPFATSDTPLVFTNFGSLGGTGVSRASDRRFLRNFDSRFMSGKASSRLLRLKTSAVGDARFASAFFALFWQGEV